MGNKTKGNHDFFLFLYMSAVRRVGIYAAAKTYNQPRLAVGERKAAWGLVLCGRDGLFWIQGTGEHNFECNYVTVQTAQGLLMRLLPGQSQLAASHFPGAVPGDTRAAKKQEDSTNRSLQL